MRPLPGGEAFAWQARQWRKDHGSLRGLRFDPVLPVIVYTGTRTWDKPVPMPELVKQGTLFADQTASLTPVFFNLATTPAKKLYDEGGLFGRVLHLVQQRHARAKDYRRLLEQVVTAVDGLPKREGGRWRDLLWYFQSMVYHVREDHEHEPLVRLIRETGRSRSRKQEVLQMGKTMAEVLIEKGHLEGKKEGEMIGKQEALLLQLRKKFGKVPKKIEAQVRAATDETHLDQWLDEILTATKLADMSFSAGS